MIKYYLALLSLAWSLSSTFATPTIHVVVQGGQKKSLSLEKIVASDKLGQQFKSVLTNDLNRSGWFKLGSQGIVSVTGSVGGLAETLNVAWPSKAFAWNRSMSETTMRKHAHELSDAIVTHIMGEKGFAQTRIAVVHRPNARQADLYIMDYDGANLKRLTRDQAPIIGPRWSADGKYLYFTSYKDDAPAVYCAEVNSGRVIKLAHFKGLNTGAVPNPVNPNQLALILSHQGNPELYVMDIQTKALKRMTRTKFASEASPAWSPDGRQIVYVSDVSRTPQLYIVNVATAASRRLTYKGSENVTPDWNAKNQIVFATRRGAPYRIGLIDANKGEASFRYLTPLNDQYESPSWAVNGRHIVTSRTQGRASTIWILDSHEDGDKPYRLFSGQGNWGNPAWSRQ